MSNVISIHGEDYIPLVAVPFISTQFFSTSCLADVLGEPESYCDENNDTVLDAYRIGSKGQLSYIPHQCFGSPGSTLPTDAVISAVKAKAVFDMLVVELKKAGKLLGQHPSWDLFSELPKAITDDIANKIIKPIKTNIKRANGRPAKLAKMQQALAKIENTARAKGVPFDKENLPGYKRHLLAILKFIDPSIRIRGSSFDWYAKQLQLKWRQGGKPVEAQPLLGLFCLSKG